MPRRLLAVLGILALTGLAGSRVRFTTDPADVLPRSSELRRTLAAAREVAGAHVLLVAVDGRGTDREALRAAVDRVAADLRALPAITEVRSGFGPEDAARIGERVEPWLGAFVAPEVLAERTSEDGVRAAMERQRARLLGPMGALVARGFQEDPLDLRASATGALVARGVPGVRLFDGLLVDREGTTALLLATSGVGPGDVRPGDPRIAAIQDVIDRAPLPTRWSGGARIAWETATRIEGDVHRGVAVGMGLLALVLALGLRSWRPLVGAVLPLALASGGTALGAWAVSPVHAIQLGFSAALAGIAVDYWIHLALAAAERPGQDTWDGRARAASEALRELGPALVLSAGSTIAAFAVLASSPLPLVRVLGVTGAFATAGALLGTVLGGPLAWAAVGRAVVRPEGPSTPGFLAAPVVLGCVALGLVGLTGSFDPDPMGLIARSPSSAADEAVLADRFGFTSARALVWLDGPTVGHALDRSARVEAALTGTGLARASGPASVLPGPAAVAARQAALPPVDVLQERLDRVAGELGLPPPTGAAERLASSVRVPPADLWDGTPLAPRVTLRDRAALVTVPLADPAVAPYLQDTLLDVDPHASLVVPTASASDGLLATRDALGSRAAWGGVLVVVGLLLWHRDPHRVVAALLPAGAALGASAGAMAFAGVPWNPVSVAAMVPVLGLSVDAGVFLTTSPAPSARRAVALSAATTLAGFAPLVLAESPALQGVGIATFAGVGASAAVALGVLPSVLAPGGASDRVRRPATALAFAAVVALHLDLGLHVVGAYTRPAPRAAPRHALEVDGATRRYGPNALTRAEGVWWLQTEGRPYDAGFASGVLTAPLRPRLERELFESFERQVPNPLARWLITRGSLVVGMGLEAHIDPRHRVEIQGSADAVPEDLWLAGPIYTRKVYYHAIHDLGQALVDTPLLGCTGFAAGGEATADGHWVVGRTFDFEGGVAFDRDKIVRVHRPDVGIPHVTVGFAGLVGAVSGLNEAGLAVVINAGASDARPRPGTPMTLIVREILETARTVEDAERILRARTGFVSENVLVVDGTAGRAALFEVGPERVERTDVDGWIAVSNHFRHPAWSDDVTNRTRQEESTTRQRLARAEELIRASLGRLDLSEASAILGDRAGVGGADLPRGHRHALDADIATHSVLIDATARVLWVTRYPNVSGGWVAIELDEALAGRLEPEERVPPDVDAHRAVDTWIGRRILREARHAGADEALALTARAQALMPDHPQALLARGRALIAAGRSDEARPLLERALASPPEYAHEAREIRALLGDPR